MSKREFFIINFSLVMIMSFISFFHKDEPQKLLAGLSVFGLMLVAILVSFCVDYLKHKDLNGHSIH